MFTIEPHLVEALGRTLLHSLWQGALLAAVLWYALRLLPEAQAARRHRYALTAALALLPAALLTFWWVYTPTSAMPSDLSLLPAGALLAPMESNAASLPVGTSLADLLSNAVPYLGYAWLLGCGLFSLRIFGSWLHQYRLRTVGTATLNAGRQTELGRIAAHLGVRTDVALRASTQVSGPLLLGWLRPLILLPVGAVNALTPDEVAAVLAHELAHLARRDNWWNAVLQLLDVLFYYHPAWWYLHRCVRTEREHACDDLALRAGAAPLVYARALVRLQELTTSAPSLALAFGDQRRPLLHRVRRILQPTTPAKSTRMEKYSLPLLLLVAVLGVGFYQAPDSIVDENERTEIFLDVLQVEDLGDDKFRISTRLHNVEQIAVFDLRNNRNLLEYTRNEQLIAFRDTSTYQEDIAVMRSLSFMAEDTPTSSGGKQLMTPSSTPTNQPALQGGQQSLSTHPGNQFHDLVDLSGSLSPQDDYTKDYIETAPGEYRPTIDYKVPMPSYRPEGDVVIPNGYTITTPITYERDHLRKSLEATYTTYGDTLPYKMQQIEFRSNGQRHVIEYDGKIARRYTVDGRMTPLNQIPKDDLFMRGLQLPKTGASNIIPPPPPPPAPAPGNESRNISIFKENGQKRIRVRENGRAQELRFDGDKIFEYRRNGDVVPLEQYDLFMDDINELKELHETTPPPPPPPPPAPRAPGIPPPPPPAPKAPRAPEGSSDVRVRQSSSRSQTVIVENNKVYVDGELVSENAEGQRIVIEDGEVIEETRMENTELQQRLEARERDLYERQAEMNARIEARQAETHARMLEQREAALARAEEAQAEAEARQQELLANMEVRRAEMETKMEASLAAAEADAARLEAEAETRMAGVELILDELERDGLHQNGKRIKLQLDEQKMTVNGKRQPDAVYRKYRAMIPDHDLSIKGNFTLESN